MANVTARRRRDKAPGAGSADLEPVPGDDITPQGVAWLHAADDSIIGCYGGQHRWPKPRLNGRPQPRGVALRPQRDGGFQIRQTCPDCTTVRVEVSLPTGVFAAVHRYFYEYPDPYRSPKGSGVTRAHASAEMRRRLSETARRQASQMKTAA